MMSDASTNAPPSQEPPIIIIKPVSRVDVSLSSSFWLPSLVFFGC